MDFYSSSRIANTSDWITTDEAKDHIRIDFSTDDTYVDALIDAAQEACEQILGFGFGTYNHVGYTDTFSRVLHFRQANLSGSPTVQHKLEDGTYQTLTTSDYKSTSKTYPGQIVFADSVHLNNVNNDPEWIQVSWSSEYTTTPKLVKQAGLMIVGHLYEMRQDVGYSRVFEVPMNSKYLLEKYRKQSFA